MTTTAPSPPLFLVSISQAPGILLHQLLEVLHRRAAAGGGGSGGGRGGGGSGGATGRGTGGEQCPPGVVEDLLAMMEQLGQVTRARCLFGASPFFSLQVFVRCGHGPMI